MSKYKFNNIPSHCVEGLRAYLEDGVKPGSFLCAVLSNDLMEAFGRADPVNRAAMFDYACWLQRECPEGARGPGNVEKWCLSHRKLLPGTQVSRYSFQHDLQVGFVVAHGGGGTADQTHIVQWWEDDLEGLGDYGYVSTRELEVLKDPAVSSTRVADELEKIGRIRG